MGQNFLDRQDDKYKNFISFQSLIITYFVDQDSGISEGGGGGGGHHGTNKPPRPIRDQS